MAGAVSKSNYVGAVLSWKKDEDIILQHFSGKGIKNYNPENEEEEQKLRFLQRLTRKGVPYRKVFHRVFPGGTGLRYAPAILQQFCEKAIENYNQEGNTYIFAQLDEAFLHLDYLCDDIVIYFKACQSDGTTTTFRARTHTSPRRIPFGPDPDVDINVTPWRQSDDDMSSTDKPEYCPEAEKLGGTYLVA